MSMQLAKLYDIWSRVLSKHGQFVLSSSFAQRAAFTSVVNEATKETVHGVREGNWEKVMRSSGTAQLKDSGPRFCSNIEAVTTVFVGPPIPIGEPRPLSPAYFPFWDDSSIPQGLKDELRVLGFRAAVNEHEMYKADVKNDGNKIVVNEFEKGKAFGQLIVSQAVARVVCVR